MTNDQFYWAATTIIIIFVSIVILFVWRGGRDLKRHAAGELATAQTRAMVCSRCLVPINRPGDYCHQCGSTLIPMPAYGDRASFQEAARRNKAFMGFMPRQTGLPPISINEFFNALPPPAPSHELVDKMARLALRMRQWSTGKHHISRAVINQADHGTLSVAEWEESVAVLKVEAMKYGLVVDVTRPAADDTVDLTITVKPAVKPGGTIDGKPLFPQPGWEEAYITPSDQMTLENIAAKSESMAAKLKEQHA